MPKRELLLFISACTLAIAGCGGSSEAANTETTPAAAAGDPSTPPTSGAEQVSSEPPAPEHATADASGPAANVAPEPQMPKHGLLILHKVKNYDAWKPVFDGDVQARKDGGLTGHVIMRGVADPNLVAIWAPVSDVEKAKAFVANKELKDKMKQAGVQGKPEILFESMVAAQMDPKQSGLSGAMLTAKVKDFAAFKAAFDTAAQARTDAGVIGYALSQDLAEPSVTYVYLQSEDAAKLKTYVEAKETKQAWKDAGVVGPAKVTLVSEGEMVMYP
jgi:quinol monooxygenase YgiN